MRLLQAVLLCLSLLTLTAACGREQAKGRNVLPEARHDYIVLGMGCFWGAEKRMSELPGVVDVESGYARARSRAATRPYSPRNAPCVPV